jgi:hypothetical protein
MSVAGHCRHMVRLAELPFCANFRHTLIVGVTNYCAILSATARYSGMPALRNRFTNRFLSSDRL